MQEGGGLETYTGGEILKRADEYAIPLNDMIDFSSNTNPLGPPEGLLNLLKEYLPLIQFYPDQDSDRLKALLGEYLRIEKERIIITNGASELIYLLSKSLLSSPCLIPSPTFSEYAYSMESSGKVVRYLKLREDENFRIHLDGILQVLDGLASIFICNPNNPTGNLIRYEELMRIIDEAGRRGVMVVVDEAFIEFDPMSHSSSLINEDLENLFVIRSMTKFFSIPGLRLGYGVGPKEVIERLEKVKPPWNVNLLAQLAAMEIIKDDDFILKTREFVPNERGFLQDAIAGIEGLFPYPSFANFLLVRLPHFVDSTILTKRLGMRGLLVRDCSSFDPLGKRFIRIGIRKREENLRLIQALKEELSGEW